MNILLRVGMGADINNKLVVTSGEREGGEGQDSREL